MSFNFNLEFGNSKEQLGAIIIQEIVLKIPSVQDEFIELLNKIADTEYTTESDTFEIIGTIQQEYKNITQAFTQALKLKNSIS